MSDSTSTIIAGQDEPLAFGESYPTEAFPMSHLGFEHERANVLGVRISAVDMDRAVNIADGWIAAGNPGYACVTGVHGVIEAQTNPEFLRILNQAAINTPDGMPMAWVGWLQGHRNMDRVYGPDFMMAMCKLSEERGYRNFLYGGNPGVAELLRESLLHRFPGLKLVGTYTPPFRALNPDEERELVEQVRDSKPHILWVGLGTPKQERFMAQYLHQLEVPLLVGVGAAFDFHTGRLHECSGWVKRAGLQWVHRLIQDPKRLWKRYLHCVPAFLWHIAWQFSGLRHYPSKRS
jgi:N-acetylglucosaminyldiphosphoundecaprenol N-acetyl-beta-D-mannosaminyltransferase